jgi:phenylpropionate dioxygenase-like ring-hydroxylating dioxygenase large terminal subunit
VDGAQGLESAVNAATGTETHGNPSAARPDGLHAVARRLLANVDAERGDESTSLLEIPVSHYTDAARYEREVEAIFHRSPLLVALSCDVRDPGHYSALTIAGRPLLVVRGDDGVVRTFLNACRHRGAQVTPDCFGSGRRFTCPYHFWVYDTSGALVGNTARAAFEGMDVDGLVELPTAERSGAVFAILTPGLPLDIDAWLGGMAEALELIDLNGLHRHRDGLVTDSGNWKATADGYVDGYHLGYLHRSTIGAKSITNRNTYDTFGPHVRLGFANKPILTMRDLPDAQWNLREAMSLVHFVFPNISISGLPGHGLMVSRILPGPTVDRCTVEQFQYFRTPMTSEAEIADADAKRELYFAVTRDEDFATVMEVTRAASALGNDVFRFGRNEVGNQNFHRWAEALADGTGPTLH